MQGGRGDGVGGVEAVMYKLRIRKPFCRKVLLCIHISGMATDDFGTGDEIFQNTHLLINTSMQYRLSILCYKCGQDV